MQLKLYFYLEFKYSIVDFWKIFFKDSPHIKYNLNSIEAYSIEEAFGKLKDKPNFIKLCTKDYFHIS